MVFNQKLKEFRATDITWNIKIIYVFRSLIINIYNNTVDDHKRNSFPEPRKEKKKKEEEG